MLFIPSSRKGFSTDFHISFSLQIIISDAITVLVWVLYLNRAWGYFKRALYTPSVTAAGPADKEGLSRAVSRFLQLCYQTAPVNPPLLGWS